MHSSSINTTRSLRELDRILSAVKYGDTIISNIIDGSATANTKLRIGDKICSINGFHFDNSAEAIGFIRNATGKMHIVAERCTTTHIEASLMKPIFMCSKKRNDVIISSFKDRHIAANTNLEIGDKILCINGSIMSNPEEVDRIIHNAEGSISIFAERYTKITTEAFITKSFQHQKVGIKVWANAAAAHEELTCDSDEIFSGRTGIISRFRSQRTISYV
mmetsp:Transcript_35882/g.70599  ORF Transcript_35882/g.70599 Transcript_35882/m.70599 type:complete len:219 (+) Transcript_35882:109-765(+)